MNPLSIQPARWLLAVVTALLLLGTAQQTMAQPELTSITRYNPTSAISYSTNVQFRADFSQDVLHVDSSDFEFSGSLQDSATITSVFPLGADAYVLNVSAATSTTGTLGLDVKGVDGTGSNNIVEDNSTLDQQSLADAQITDSPIFGQSFVAGSSGILVRVTVQTAFTHTYSGPGTLDLIAGNGYGGQVLATENISVTSSLGEKHYYFSTPPSITSGSTYTLRFNFPGAPSLSTAFSAQVGANYSGGTLYQASVFASADLYFKTYVAATSGAPLSSTLPALDESFSIAVCNVTASAAMDTQANCLDQAGVATVTPAGGTSPYSYDWSSGDHTASASNLSADSYTVQVTDAVGCTASTSVNVTQYCDIEVISSTGYSIPMNSANPSVANGTQLATSAVGDTLYYNFRVDNNTINTLALSNPLSITGSHANLFFVASAPGDSLYPADSTTFSIGFSSADFVVADATISMVNTGSGSSPFSFDIRGLVTHSGFSFDGSDDHISVPDANSLDVSNAFTVETWIRPSSNHTAGLITKFGNGSSNRSYALLLISNGTIEFSLSVDGANEIYVGSSTTVPTNTWTHVAGTYDGTTMRMYFNGVEDPNTQVASGSVFNSSKPLLLGARDNGSVALNYHGDMDEVRLWNTARTTQELNHYKNCSPMGNETGLVLHYNFNNGVPAGNNAAQSTVPDQTGNGNDGSITNAALSGSTSNYAAGPADNVVGTCTVPLALATSANNVLCFGGASGSATVMASNGTTPYTYLWSTGDTASTSASLIAGTYTVTVTDAGGSTATASTSVSEPAAMSIQTSGSGAVCSGATTGTASGSASGGTTPYTYLWSTGASTSAINSLGAGTYTLTVTDGNGCNDTSMVTIATAAQLQATASANNPDCHNSYLGEAAASASGGSVPYSFAWSNGSTTSIIVGLTPATYTATVTDAAGCTATTNATVAPAAALVVSTNVTANVSCSSNGGGDATATASGGSTPYSFSWSSGASTNSIAGMPIGTYTVTVTDANACTATDSLQFTSNCAAPGNLKEWNIQDTMVTLRWDTVCGATAYRVRWKAVGAANWNVAYKQSNQGSRIISGLTSNTKYRWNVASKCGQVWSSTSTHRDFWTLAAACPAPSGLSTTPVQADKARLNWGAVAGAKTYRIRWRVQGTQGWTVVRKDGGWTKHWLKNLSAATTYEWGMKTQCGKSSATPWSATETFTTAPTAKTASAATGPAFTTLAATLFPNPARHTATVRLTTPEASEVTVQLLTTLGAVLQTQRVACKPGQQQLALELEGFAAGLYLVRLDTEWGPQLLRLVIE